MKPKILLLGSSHTTALEMIYADRFRSLGHYVHVFNSTDAIRSRSGKNVITKIVFRLFPSFFYFPQELKLLQHLKANRYNIMFVFKGMFLSRSILAIIRQVYPQIKLVNYNPDHPFIFSGRGRGNKNVSNSVSLYHLYLTYDEGALTMLKNTGVRSSLYTFGFDDKMVDKLTALFDEINEICFIGNPDKYRADFLIKLGIILKRKIYIFGSGWEAYLPEDRFILKGPVYDIEFWQKMRMFRVQINIMRKHNSDGHNMRSFDVPGAGGIMLAPRTKDHLKFFSDTPSVFLYDTVQDAAIIVKNLLEKNREEALSLRLSGKKSVAKFAYTKIIEDVSKELCKL